MSPQASLRKLTNALAADNQPDRVNDLFGVDIDPQSSIDGLDKVSSPFALSLATTLHDSWNPSLTSTLDVRQDLRAINLPG